mgnify:CR=1 FL=1
MKQIFVFAGTSEGREICERLSRRGISCTVSVATEYGEKLLPKSEKIEILQGRLNHGQMVSLFSKKAYDFVIDATHPFATEVSKEIKKACLLAKKRYIRFARECGEGTLRYSQDDGAVFFRDISSCGDWLENQEGGIFVSTGSKELSLLCEKISDKARLFVRVLPSVESLKICEKCGIIQKQIIAMQGPFSEKTNEVQFEESGAKILVTKESGRAGGYFEKIEAAKKLGMKIAVIENPEKEILHYAQNDSPLVCSGEEALIFHSVDELIERIV